MPKNLFQDMVKIKNSKKQMDSIELPRSNPQPQPQIKPEYTYRGPENIYSPVAKKSNAKYGIWIVAFVSIIFFIFALSFFFARAGVSVNPKIKDIQLNESFSAVKDVSSDGGLSFDLVIISGEDTKQVIGGEKKDLSLSASGQVFLYNTFSSTPQKLTLGTKLEGSNGKIYKITEAVTIPGFDEEGLPGKVGAGIVGVEAGEEYNTEPIDFKIASFKGTSKYDKFYGRSQGKIVGGFKGLAASVSDVDKEVAFAELTSSLKEKLLMRATDQIPKGFILYKDAAFLTIDEESVEFSQEGSNVPVKVKGTLYGFLLDEKSLTQKIAKETINDYDDSEIYIPNIRDLVFSLPNTEVSYADIQNITFNLSGSPKVVWKFDDVKFTQELLGKSKKDFNQMLTEYPHVDSAELTLSPFWIRTLPTKLKDIKVIVNYPQ